MGEIEQLVIEACQHPPGSPKRQRYLTQVIRLVSSKLWHESVPYYADALQQTWIFFCQNVCESGTGARYDSSRATVVTWLNNYLRRRLQDGTIAAIQEGQRRANPIATEPGEAEIDPLDRVPAPPDVPPILDRVRQWAETDPTGELGQTHIEGYPQVTCQVLILRRLPPEASWSEISAEFGLKVPTLSSFYQRQCLPRLRKFGESEGYI